MPKIIDVKFKGSRRVLYKNPNDIELKRGDYVFVEAERGEDMGIVVSPDVNASILKQEKKELKNVIRKAVESEIAYIKELREKEINALKTCKERAIHHKMEMKLIDAEYQYDGNKVTFYFVADKRIDFRAFVRDLASIFKTRIELRQIGEREECKRLDGYGCCGQKLCCSTFLRDFAPVTLQMARDQHISLNPNKMSGVCGRLMCCLSYEDELYRELLKKFPRIGAKVKVGEITAKVVDIDIFNEMVIIEKENAVREKVKIENIKLVEGVGKMLLKKTKIFAGKDENVKNDEKQKYDTSESEHTSLEQKIENEIEKIMEDDIVSEDDIDSKYNNEVSSIEDDSQNSGEKQ